MMKKITLLLSIMFPLANCSHKKMIKKTVTIHASAKVPKVVPTPTAPRITVWVHGTKGLGSISDHIHATSHQGLAHYATVPRSYRIGAVMKSLIDADSLQFPSEHFYIFGWSGKRNFDERLAESKKLYMALRLLIDEYQTKYGICPQLTLITHSHGGNVALNLSCFHNQDKPLAISQLILLACPVQHETEHLIAHSMFEKVYSLYSTSDMIQVLDPQGMYLTPHNKKRHLELSNRQFPIYPQVRQVKLKINGHGIMHIGFITNKFIKMLPFIIHEIEQWHIDSPSCNHEREMRVNT